MENKKYKNGLIAGTFLCVHPGHIYLFKEAKKICKRIIVVIANDKRIKKKYSIKENTAKERKEMLSLINIIDKVIIGKENIKESINLLDKEKIDVVITCKEHQIPKEIIEYIKNKGIKFIEILCYKKYIYSTHKVIKYE